MQTLDDLRRVTRELEFATSQVDLINQQRDHDPAPVASWRAAVSALRTAHERWHETWVACTGGAARGQRLGGGVATAYYWDGGRAR
ncbi:MAG: hypothetical protein LC640_12390 [Frankia sp.]|nr:hypothetical protein [Frankia sp.]